MKNYLVIIKTQSEAVYILKIKADSFAHAEKDALKYPLLKEILQISIYN